MQRQGPYRGVGFGTIQIRRQGFRTYWQAGTIQYAVDDPDDAGAWRNTGVNTASGSTEFSAEGLADGGHTVYIRGKDAAGNRTGTPKGAAFLGDCAKARPGRACLCLPSSWTNAREAALSWSGMQDVTGIAHVYYRVDSGEWIDTGVTQGNCTGYQVDMSELADGKHRIEVCGEDVLGNMGVSGVGGTVDKTGQSRKMEK